MNRFFDKELPPERRNFTTFKQLVESYRATTCVSLLEGILHDVAKGTWFTNDATRFLLEIASEATEVESSHNLRREALGLFFQRVLPNVQVIDTECCQYILGFFATEPRLYQRIGPMHRNNIKKFLCSKWIVGREELELEPIYNRLLLDATIGVEAYDLLVQYRAIEAIPRLYHLLMRRMEIEYDDINYESWLDIFSIRDVDVRRHKLSRRMVRAKFLDDSTKINTLCGRAIVDGDPKDMAQTLLALLSILHHRLYQ